MRHAIPLLATLALVGCQAGQSSIKIGGDTDKPSIITDTSNPTTAPWTAIFGTSSAEVVENMGSVVRVSWEQDRTADVRVEFSEDGQNWRSSRTRTLDEGAHEDLILGVPFGADITWRLVGDAPNGTEQTDEGDISTDPAPSGMPEPTLLANVAQDQDPDSNYLFAAIIHENPGAGDRAWSLIVDREGRVIWAASAPQGFQIMHNRPSWNGDRLLVDLNSFWGQFDGGAQSQVLTMTIDGVVENTQQTPGMHHAFTGLPDGSIAWSSAVNPWSNGRDEEIRIVSPDGDETTFWSCQDDWLADLGVNFGCSSNTLSYDLASDTFLLSLYSLETAIEVDATSAATNRWFGHTQGAYAFDPPQSEFWWQHGVNYTEDGTLLVSTKDRDGGNETLVREYAIDTPGQTLTEIWSFGEGEGRYGYEMGEALRLGNGNTHHNYGAQPAALEVTPLGDVLWEVEWNGQYEIGKSTFINDLYDLVPDLP